MMMMVPLRYKTRDRARDIEPRRRVHDRRTGMDMRDERRSGAIGWRDRCRVDRRNGIRLLRRVAVIARSVTLIVGLRPIVGLRRIDDRRVLVVAATALRTGDRANGADH